MARTPAKFPRWNPRTRLIELYRVGDVVIERRGNPELGEQPRFRQTRVDSIDADGTVWTETGACYTRFGLSTDATYRSIKPAAPVKAAHLPHATPPKPKEDPS